MVITPMRLTVVAALVVAGCASSSSLDASVMSSVTQPARVESIGYASPEVLVENIIAAIRRGDAAALESTLPAETWEPFGAVLLDGFEPLAGEPPCTRATDTSAHCLIFDGASARVLEVDAGLGDGRWVPTRAVIESTN